MGFEADARPADGAELRGGRARRGHGDAPRVDSAVDASVVPVTYPPRRRPGTRSPMRRPRAARGARAARHGPTRRWLGAVPLEALGEVLPGATQTERTPCGTTPSKARREGLEAGARRGRVHDPGIPRRGLNPTKRTTPRRFGTSSAWRRCWSSHTASTASRWTARQPLSEIFSAGAELPAGVVDEDVDGAEALQHAARRAPRPGPALGCPARQGIPARRLDSCAVSLSGSARRPQIASTRPSGPARAPSPARSRCRHR